ncbi:transglycosylase SLT domain-containing protein [Pontibacter russatus]|uniref:transglycosylase SLT domain-containing protein n=1 Tax=Pontibacter russatus TaxID=2694929 RepID=UPI00192A5376|nr:transglycosylase SLT domain-containing protein [Pontibacter russatus]
MGNALRTTPRPHQTTSTTPSGLGKTTPNHSKWLGKTTPNHSASNSELAELLVMGGAAGLLLLLFSRQADPLTPSAKENRVIEFTSAYALHNTGYTRYSNMAGLGDTEPKKLKISTVPIPMVEQAHYQSHMLPTIQRQLDEIDSKYGKTMFAVQGVTRVPYDLLKTIMYIESGGNPQAVSGAGAVGLMQLLPDTATMVIALENIKKRLSDYEKDWLRETLGRRLDEGILKMRDLGSPVANKLGITKNRFVSKSDLFHAEFNILCGALFLGILLDESLEPSGLYRVDKVVVRYNMGYFSMKKGREMVGTAAQLVDRLPSEPAAYIRKLVGKNGLLTLV